MRRSRGQRLVSPRALVWSSVLLAIASCSSAPERRADSVEPEPPPFPEVCDLTTMAAACGAEPLPDWDHDGVPDCRDCCPRDAETTYEPLDFDNCYPWPDGCPDRSDTETCRAGSTPGPVMTGRKGQS